MWRPGLQTRAKRRPLRPGSLDMPKELDTQVQQLVQTLAMKLASLVEPHRVDICSRGGALVVENSYGMDLMTDVSDRIARGERPDEAVVGGINNLLIQVQDALTVAVGLAWPAVTGGALSEFAVPIVKMVNGTLVFWFEDVRGRQVTPQISLELDLSGRDG